MLNALWEVPQQAEAEYLQDGSGLHMLGRVKKKPDIPLPECGRPPMLTPHWSHDTQTLTSVVDRLQDAEFSKCRSFVVVLVCGLRFFFFCLGPCGLD